MPTPTRSTWALGLGLAWLCSEAGMEQDPAGDDDGEPMTMTSCGVRYICF